MESVFCVDFLEEALRSHGKLEIFNSDQGAQFSSEALTAVLKQEGLVINMDGRGRVFDNAAEFLVSGNNNSHSHTLSRLWRSGPYSDFLISIKEK